MPSDSDAEQPLERCDRLGGCGGTGNLLIESVAQLHAPLGHWALLEPQLLSIGIATYGRSHGQHRD